MIVLAAADRALRCRAHPRERSQVARSLTYIELWSIAIHWMLRLLSTTRVPKATPRNRAFNSLARRHLAAVRFPPVNSGGLIEGTLVREAAKATIKRRQASRR